MSLLKLHSHPASRIVRFAGCCFLAALCVELFWSNGSQARREIPPVQTPNQNLSSTSGDEEDVFVIYRDEHGRTKCRAATNTERQEILNRSGGGATRVIYGGASREKSPSGFRKSNTEAT